MPTRISGWHFLCIITSITITPKKLIHLLSLTYLQTKMRFCGKVLRWKCNKDSNFVYKYHIQKKKCFNGHKNTQKMRKTNRLLTVKITEL